MKRYPVQIKFYRVLGSMEIDLDHLVQSIDQKTKAVLVTHYFGFPQDIDVISGLCKEKGLYLIEDCAHGLYGARNGRWLGTSGDLGVFSLRKTLPLPDGGVLLINNPALTFTGSMIRPPLDAYLGGVKELLQIYARSRLGGVDVAEFWVVKRAIEGIKRYRKRVTGIDYSLGADSFEPRTGDYEASWITKALLKRVRGEEVIRRRRQNYLFLLEHLDGEEGVCPVRRDLPEGVCPLYFPLRVSDSTEYGRRLQASGIEAMPFWSHGASFLPKDVFEDTLSLKKTILALPIHQDLTLQHMRKIADALRGILGYGESR
jgi:dTDP-4-amino-4,6-dideoxygalactose transaminase